MILSCPFCGKEFEYNGNSYNKQYCSVDCRKRAYWKKLEEGRSGKNRDMVLHVHKWNEEGWSVDDIWKLIYMKKRKREEVEEALNTPLRPEEIKLIQICFNPR